MLSSETTTHIPRRSGFESLLTSRSGLVRKGASTALKMPRFLARLRATEDNTSAVLANSFPKSGTHLLDQIVAALPAVRNFGTFLASMTGSAQFRERTPHGTISAIERLVPGELARAHLFHDDSYAQALHRQGVVHFFIYRDPRDVVVSEAHYLRSINRWHRLHPYFRRQRDIRAAIRLSIRGLSAMESNLDYPNIRERFRRYAGWFDCPAVHAVRFEELVSDQRELVIREMVDFYSTQSTDDHDVEQLTQRCIDNIDPARSHTHRRGKQGGWRDHFDDELAEEFKQLAGDLLVELQYEHDLDW